MRSAVSIRTWLMRTSVAAASVLAASAACAAALHFGDSHALFVLFIPAALAATWWGGVAAGIAAALAGYLLGDYAFLDRPGSPADHGPAEVAVLLTYSVATLTSILLVGALRRAQRRARTAMHEASVRSECLEHEIADRRRAEQTLVEAEAKYRCLVEESLVGVYLIQDGRFVYVNSRLAEIFGYQPAEVVGRTVADLVAPDDRDLVTGNVRKRETGEVQRIHYTFRGLCKDGRIVDVEVIGASTLYHGKLSVLGSLLDVTERKRAEEAMRLSEEHFRRTFDESPIGAAIVGLDRRYKRVNDAFCRITGYSKEELVHLRIDDITHPDDLSVDQQATSGMASGAIPNWETDKRYIRKDGRVVWVHLSARLMCDGSGRPLYFLPMMQDITARKEAEVQLRKAKEAAEVADRAKDRFLAVLSHELRTPLAPVLAATSLMQKDSGLPPDVLCNLEMIRRNVSLEARLIDDLLDLTRISKGKLELSVSNVDVLTLLRHTLETCAAEIQDKNLRVTLDAEHGPRWLRGDPSRLQQVFWNLLRNAVKFTPDGGAIVVRAAGQRADGCRRPGAGCPLGAEGSCPVLNAEHESIVVEISDSGIGIEPDQIGRLFEAFEQGDVAVTRKFGGLGLGLSICRALVEMHGGKITASSPGKGHGSTFRVELPACSVRLPLCEEANGVKRAVSARPPVAAAGLHVLLVEDHVDTARIMAQLLRGLGHAVEVAHDVASALGLAGREEFDVIISDLGLPDGSGLDLMRRLRAGRCTARAIALTGYGMEEDLRQTREAGFCEHLIKPVDVARLEEVLARAAEDAPDADRIAQLHAP